MIVTTVGEVSSQVRGVTYDKSVVRTEPTEAYVPLLRGGNIGSFGLNWDDLQYVPDAIVRDAQKLRSGDIVIAASSGSLSAVGKAAPFDSSREATFGAFCKALRPGPAVDARYFAHYFGTAIYRDRVSALAEGANINNLRREHIDRLPFPLPDLGNQRRIAAILDKADELRAKRRQVLAHLDTLTRSIFHSTFDAQNKPRMLALADAVAPGTIVTYGIVQAGEEFPGGVPYIRTGDLSGGVISPEKLRHTNPEIAAKFARSRVATGDLVMSIRATVGTVAITPDSLNGANLTQGTARIAPGPELTGAYLLEYLRGRDPQRWIWRHVKGATFKEITLERLRHLPVVVPPLKLQEDFTVRVAAVDRLKENHRKHLVELDTLFASLQHRAFNGEL